jgi:hypothetical protein
LLVIIALVILWYGLVPVGGAFIVRRRWRVFRRRFDELRLRPFLDYAAYSRGGGGTYRFIGGFESVTDGRTLWIRSETLTIPVSLAGAHTYMLPMPEREEFPEAFDPGEEAPERIRWDRVTALAEGAKVFVGGALLPRDDRLTFVSGEDNPLLVIFYDGPDRSLTSRAIRAGRHKNEYWNMVTPYGFILGAFSQILMATSFLPRPAFRLTAITAFIAIFTPLFPLIPPGLLFTGLYRRLWWRARALRAYRDLVRLPLKYLPQDQRETRLPDGERYGALRFSGPPAAVREKGLPLVIPEAEGDQRGEWYVFGALGEDAGETPGEERRELPVKPPRDPLATYGAIPGAPEALARSFTLKAYVLEVVSWLALLGGIALNAFFIGIIIILLL